MLGLLAFSAADAAPARALEEEGPARVSPQPRTSEPHRLRLTLGTGLTLGLADVETQESDVVSLANTFYRWNVSIAPSYQLSRTWALAARGSWSSDAGARGTDSSSLWQLGSEIRQQPRGWLGLYVAAGLSAAAARDSVGGETVTQWAPALGAAVGHDVGLAEPLALGVELRGGVAFFDPDGASLRTEAGATTVTYGATSWLSLNLTGQLGL
jgi:hypothetical protein